MPSPRPKASSAPLPGARESSAGDDFHILWAARRALDLLDPDPTLKALSVEGPSPDEAIALDPKGDRLLAIDLAEYYGGVNFHDAREVHFCQLKYSTRNPQDAWTAARLATGRGGESKKSTIARLAQTFLRYQEAYGRVGIAGKLNLRLISNQPVSATLKKALDRVGSILGEAKPPRRTHDLVSKLDQRSKKEVERLKEASALSSADFVNFLAALDLSGCRAGSRDFQRTLLLGELESLGLSESERGDLAKLKMAIHQRMMPEASKQPPLDRDSLLPIFGISGYQKLFPCPPELSNDTRLIERSFSRRLAETVLSSARPVLLHATGGIGKTTVISDVARFLPSASIHLLFDCYGGGTYMNPADARHTHHRALIQLANELAQKSGTPFLLPNNGTPVEDLLRDLHKRLETAATAVRKASPEAIVLITIDAADNCIHAAKQRSETSFVTDLLLQPMPQGVKLALSCRTEHRSSLPSGLVFDEIEIPAFTPEESRQHLHLYLGSSTDSQCRNFHDLTNGVPRVQKYLLDRTFTSFDDLLQPVRPDGKGLDELFEAWLLEAFRKSGVTSTLDRLLAILINLPRPVPLRSLGFVTGDSEDLIRSFCSDAGRGLVIRGDEISFRDQDFEDYLRGRASSQSQTVIREIATRLLEVRSQEPYAARHLHEFLKLSGRAQELFDIVFEEGMEIKCLDSVEAASVFLERLKAALHMSNPGSPPAIDFRLLFLAAEAKKRDLAVRNLILENPGLAIRHNGPENLRNLCERFEIDDEWPAPGHWRKARIFSLLPETKDRAVTHLTEAEGWVRWWSSQPKHAKEEWKRHHWHRIEDHHLADAVEAIMRVAGLERAYLWLATWTPKEMYATIIRQVVLSVLDEDGSERVMELIGQRPWRADLALYLFSTLSERCVSLKPEELHRLGATWHRFVRGGRVPPGLRLYLLRLCEKLSGLGTDAQGLAYSLLPHLNPGVPAYPSLGRYDGGTQWVPHLHWLTLREILDGQVANLDEWLPIVPSPPGPDATRDERSRHDEEIKKRKEWEDIYRLLLPAFRLRARILAGRVTEIESKELTGAIQRPFEHYEDNRRRDADELREALLVFSADVINESGSRAENHAKALIGILRSWPYGWSPRYLLPLVERLNPKAGLAEVILEVLAEVTKILSAPDFSGAEKIDHFLRMADITRRFHSAAASEYFQKAINAAEDIDQEAPYQIRALARLGSITASHMGSNSPAISHALARFAEQTYVTLGHPKHWPWEELFDGIASMHPASLPAILARWDDRGFRELERHFAEAAEALLSKGFWKASEVLCLAVINYPYHLKPLLASIANSERSLVDSALRMIERDILVFLEPEAREQAARAVCEWAEVNHYRNHASAMKLSRYLAFRGTLAPPSYQSTPQQISSRREKHGLAEVVATFGLPVGPITVQTLCDFLRHANDVKERGHYVSSQALIALQERVSLNMRLTFLDSLLELGTATEFPDVETLEILEGCKDRWRSDPSVLAWFHREDAALRFMSHTTFRYFSKERWRRILDLFGLSPLAGLRLALPKLVERLEFNSAEDLYQAIEAFAGALPASDAADVLRQEFSRIEPRIHPDSGDGPWDARFIPSDDPTESMAGFLWKILGHPDKRLRWRGAHAVRRLARLGTTDVLSRLIAHWEIRQFPAFCDRQHPFFWLSARTWLATALDRIAGETPEAVKPFIRFLIDQAVGCDPPHALQKFYAKRACLKLAESASSAFTRKQLQQLRKCCVSPHPQKKRNNQHRFSDPKIRKLKHDYRFDTTDTIPYWFSDLTGLFSVPMEEVTKRAAEYICGRWHFTESEVWSHRTTRGRHEDWNLSSHRHGEEPTIEHLGRYLDWHAMMCVATDLLGATPLTKPQWNDESANPFEEFLRRWTPHFPDLWLADLIQPTPHEPLLHSSLSYPPEGWARNISWRLFDENLRSPESILPDFFTVSAHLEASGYSCRESVGISSALVDHMAAHALMAALQSCRNSYDYKLPDEGEEDMEFNDAPFVLKGWLRENEAAGGYTDDKDPLRRSTSEHLRALGRGFLDFVGAHESDDRSEYLDDNESPVAVRQIWDESRRESRGSGYEPGMKGTRLLVKTEKLLEYLAFKECCLVIECTVDRYQDRKSDEHAPRKAKIYLLHPDGQLESLREDPLAGETNRIGLEDGR